MIGDSKMSGLYPHIGMYDNYRVVEGDRYCFVVADRRNPGELIRGVDDYIKNGWLPRGSSFTEEFLRIQPMIRIENLDAALEILRAR